MILQSYLRDTWQPGTGKAVPLLHAVNGEPVAELAAANFNSKEVLDYARKVGGPNLRAMTFHQRGLMLKSLAQYLMSRKDEFYAVSQGTGATKIDSWIDIEGGIGTVFTYASKGRRELPNDVTYLEGPVENISKGGTFVGRHLCVPLQGVALHINAFNFPCWGMLEKLAPTLLAGMPAIVKPASLTSYLAEKMVRAIIESGLLPKGALQLICGNVGDMFDHLTCQDVVTLTGSAATGKKLKTHPNIIDNSIRFNLEADSLNCSILGADATPDTEEFKIFIKEVSREITVKAGQKCTAIRRTIVPAALVDDVTKALSAALTAIKVGDPQTEGVKMGPLAGRDQVNEVRERVRLLSKVCEVVHGDPDSFELTGADAKKGAFFPAMLLYCDKPFATPEPHAVEAFGPVSTIMPYKTTEEAIELARLGAGSLVGSVITANDRFAREIVHGAAPYHGRMVLINRHSVKESTGHGSPLPHLVHGGPGRAGGGEEMGGIRAVLHYMQRTAIQGHPTTLTVVGNEWVRGAEQIRDSVHPFRKYFEELKIGETLITEKRTVTEKDVQEFADISGDYFYAHMDEEAAAKSIFEKRVAHGYFVLSAAAGLFVDPAPGPVMANYGLENLRFTKPVYIGDSFYCRLTVKQKTPKEGEDRGVVAWDVEVFNQAEETVAVYTILTLVKRKDLEA